MKLSMKSLLINSLIITVAVLFTTHSTEAQQTTPPDAEGKTVYEAVKSSEETSDFAQLLEKSGYADILKKQGPYTILAPSNEALEESGENVEELNENPEKVKNLIRGHLYQGEVPSDQVESQMGVSVEESDDSPSNGVVHVVDQIVQQ